MTATTANLNTINDAASFNKLSPSTILSIVLGAFTCRIIVVAEIASGGEMIPPKRNPNAKVKPGINALEKIAIAVDVNITIGNAKLIITLRHLQNSFQETCQAASYNNGGRKMKKMKSGLIVMFENVGTKLNASPPITRTIG